MSKSIKSFRCLMCRNLFVMKDKKYMLVQSLPVEPFYTQFCKDCDKRFQEGLKTE